MSTPEKKVPVVKQTPPSSDETVAPPEPTATEPQPAPVPAPAPESPTPAPVPAVAPTPSVAKPKVKKPKVITMCFPVRRQKLLARCNGFVPPLQPVCQE